MCIPVCQSGCFAFGIVLNILLLALTIWSATSNKPFAVWVSLLVTFLLCFVYQVTITLARFRDGPRANSSYIVPLSNTDIEMLTYYSPPPRPLHPHDSTPRHTARPRPGSEDVQWDARYQRILAERPLPPIPARNPSRPSIHSAVLVSPLSDPFINVAPLPEGVRLSAREGGITIRQVPQSSTVSRI